MGTCKPISNWETTSLDLTEPMSKFKPEFPPFAVGQAKTGYYRPKQGEVSTTWQAIKVPDRRVLQPCRQSGRLLLLENRYAGTGIETMQAPSSSNKI